MPLLDHFHPPLLNQRHWEGFHNRWAAALSDSLNDRLPPEYFAEFQVTLGTRIEVDVATFTEAGVPEPARPEGGGVAAPPMTWAPPAPTTTISGTFPDDFAIHVFSTAAGPTLVAAIELVSPANKDREETRRAFAMKCAAYLQRGIGLIVVDVITSRQANLHDLIVSLLGHAAASFPTPTLLYATAYRPVHREANEIDVWREPLALGQPLPTLPLAIRGLGSLAVDLEETYTEARTRSRIN